MRNAEPDFSEHSPILWIIHSPKQWISGEWRESVKSISSQEEREDFAILQVFTLEISAVYMHW